MEDGIDRVDVFADQRDDVGGNRDVFRDGREIRIAEEPPNVRIAPREQVVDPDDGAAVRKQPFDEMRTDESGASRNDCVHGPSLTRRAPALRLNPQIGPLGADFIALDSHECVDDLRARQHARASQLVISAQRRDATVPSVPLEIVPTWADKNSLQRHPPLPPSTLPSRFCPEATYV